MAIDPTTTTTVKVSELASAGYNTTDLIPHEVAGILKKGNLQDLATFIGGIISTEGAVGFRAVTVTDGQTLPATTEEEFILVGPGTYPNVAGGSAITTTEPLNALVSNGTYWFIGVEIPIGATGVWGTISGTLDDQTDLKDVLDLKADLVDGKVPSSQLPSYVDDVVEVANYAALPSTGETGKIYLTLDNNKIYRWSGSAYIEIADNNAVWGMITGTLSDQTDLNTALGLKVPYTGATGNVDLGAYKLTASDLVVNHTSGSGTAATISKGGNGEALTVTKSSGSGNVASFAGGVTSISELHLTTDLADDYIASAATWNAKQSALNGTGFVKASGTTISYDNTTYVPTSRRLTINGTDYDLTADRSWTILSGAWGYISGTLSDQEDLQAALDLKATDASVVKITTDQNIRGIKTFLGDQTATTLKLIVADYYNDGFITSDNGMLRLLNGSTELFNLASTGDLTAKSFVKTGGTASQFLKANGTVDSTTYLSGTVAITNGGTGATTASAARTNLGATTIGNAIFTLPNAGLTSFLRVNTDNTVELLGAELFRTSIGAGTGNGTVTSVEAVGSYGGLTLTGTVTGSGQITLGGTPEGTWPISISGNASSVNTVQVSTNADFYLTFADANNGSPTSEFLYTIGTVKVNPSTGALTAGSFVKSGGTSSQFLKADGSIDSTTYQTALTNPVSGTGTTNYIPKFTGASALGNSLIYDDGTNVGIGTITPTLYSGYRTLSLNNTSGAALELKVNDVSGLKIFSDSGQSYLYESRNMPLGFYTNSTERMRIGANGNISIGDTPILPNSDWFGALTLGKTGTDKVVIGYVSSLTNGATIGAHSSALNAWADLNITGGDIIFRGGEVARMRITSGGNVGIGTQTPSFPLSFGTSLGNKIGLYDAASGNGYGFGIQSNLFQMFTFQAEDDISFGHGNSAAFTRNVTFKGNGNVGIGTTSPAQKLDVSGIIRASSDFEQTGNSVFKNTSYDMYLQTDAAGAGIIFRTSGATERMRITSGGAVGIGIVPQFTVGGYLSMEIGTAGLLYSTTNTNNSTFTIGGGLYYNGGWKYKNNAAGSLISQNEGNIAFETAPTGTIGAAATITERMRIFKNGNVFIGSSAVDGGYKFDVIGTGRFTEALTASSITTTVSALANATLGTIASTWGGTLYPTLYGSATDRWVMHINPHISYTQNGVNGFAGSMTGSTIRMASDPAANSFWDIGVGTNGVGADKFSIGRAATGFFSITNSGAATFSSTVTASGGFFNSDMRLKDLTDYDYSVSDIKPITYLWKDGRDNKKHVGYSAQEVQKVMPDAVNEGTDGMLSVNYVEVLVAKIAELENRIKQLEK